VVDLLAAEGAARIPNTVSRSELPFFATSRGSDDGCFEAALPLGAARATVSARGWSPVSVEFDGGPVGGSVGGLAGLVWEGAVNIQPDLLSDRPDESSDLRRAMFVAVQACTWPAGPIRPEQEVCFGLGIDGVRAELVREDDSAIDAAWARPRYFGATTALPQEGLQATSTNGTAYFWNVPPGRYVVRLHAPDGKTMACSLDPTESGFGWGLPGPDDNTLSVYAAPGLNNFAGRMFCRLD
jgi:hypothetical protein